MPKDTSRGRSCGSWPLTLTAEYPMTCGPSLPPCQANPPINNGKTQKQYRETAAIITLYLESSPTQLDSDVDPRDGADALSLLGPDIDAFYADLPILMPSFANALSTTVQDLRAIVNAGDSHARAPSAPSDTSRARARNRQSMIRAAAQAPLAPQILDRTRHLRRMQLSDIPASRARLATTAAEVLSAKAQVLERAVVLLERTKHGAVARATKAKAEHLAMVAEGVDGKLR